MREKETEKVVRKNIIKNIISLNNNTRLYFFYYKTKIRYK